MPLVTINPATGETVRAFPELSREEIDGKLDAARTAFRAHRRSSFREREDCLVRLAEVFEAEQDSLAALAALEMGKPLAQGRAEAVKCAAACRYVAANGAALLADQPVDDHSFVRHDPLGVVLALMPWNFPFWQVIRCAAPALMPGVRALIDDPRVDAVSLTGSVGAGRDVAAAAGAKIKRTVLELGGSDPFLVLPSADLEKTIAAAVQSRTQNSGQSCIAAKRFIVHAAVYDRFVDALVPAFRALRLGDPLAPGTQLGPIAQARGLETLERQVRDAVRAGAKILTGGRRLDRPGFFFEPTLLAGLAADAPIAREEFFGPVALLFRVRDLDEALVLANATPFGLAASVWTADAAERDRAIAEIDAGQVFVNAAVASSPELPFGGVKESGYGRELGAAGLREFVNAKSVRLGKS